MTTMSYGSHYDDDDVDSMNYLVK